MADGEYVWMPYEQARQSRKKGGGDGKDTFLWWIGGDGPVASGATCGC